MVITDKIYITDPLQEDIVAGGGQFVTFPEVSEERQRCVATHVRNLTEEDAELQLLSQLCDSTGKVVAEATTPLAVKAQRDRLRNRISQ